ncbi:MAG: ergothioneine biosynthesis protein EgtB [Solirubrobacteraceae bacterium]|jgi:gamma-glutamyl hercynylcysteine S-oxide synthase|nr:ergothioneine biosynthesis protein EgtB [Solirubrobacteraceae bacterium]MDP4673308.1 ergothioneine biosynthesis protein EgtB [Solirubrobacteraceae bacterium]
MPTMPASAGAAGLPDLLESTRRRTLELTGAVSDQELERQIDPIMSPLVWDMAHIAAYEDLWLVHRGGGKPLLRPELAALYDAFETPRAVRGEIEQLNANEAREYLAAVRARALELAAQQEVDAEIAEMVLRHELQHRETICQTLALAQLPGFDPDFRESPPPAPGGHSGLEFVEVDGGELAIGASGEQFAYDNELPRRAVRVERFEIARTPVTNASWLEFTSEGGYHERQWWSDEGWAWVTAEAITSPLYWELSDSERPLELTSCGPRALDPDRPVAHISFFEAEAFASARGARLPSEAEWEAAAQWQHGAPSDRSRANVGQISFDTAPVGAYPDGAADCGAHDLIGNLWEWTASEFDGYPGFSAHPYPEYSEVFFRKGYRVLRGGSWATDGRVASPSFRNWDLPQRRQIFSGVRLVRDVPQ